MIDQPNLIDVEKRAVAMRDLESVIQLSAQLKKDADGVSGKIQK